MENTFQKMICRLCGGPALFWGEKNSFFLYKCQKCKLIFTHPLPDTSSIYDKDYFSGAENGFGYVDYDLDKEPMIPTFNKYLDLCSKYGKNSGKLFDVGAATGFFLDIAKSRGFEVSGVEMSKFAVDKAVSKGLHVCEGDIKAAYNKENTFDVVTMFDVLEHMKDPFSEIKEAGRILKQKGLLVINTPNGQSFLARLLGKKWHLVLPPEHLYYFSPANLGDFLSKNGFTILYKKSVGKRFNFSYLFKTLYKWQNLKIWDLLSKFFSKKSLSKLYLPINLYDNFLLIAQKNEE